MTSTRPAVDVASNALAVLAGSSALPNRRDVGEHAEVHDDFDGASVFGGYRPPGRANRLPGDPRRERIMAALAALVDALLDPSRNNNAGAPEYYSADRLPPGEKSWRAVLERGRRGAYDLVHVGRHVVVPAASYASWIASSSLPRAAHAPRATPSKLERLARMGVAVPASRAGR